MVLIEGFLATFTIVDVESALKVLDLQVTESLFSKIVEGGVSRYGIATYRTLFAALQPVL